MVGYNNKSLFKLFEEFNRVIMPHNDPAILACTGFSQLGYQSTVKTFTKIYKSHKTTKPPVWPVMACYMLAVLF